MTTTQSFDRTTDVVIREVRLTKERSAKIHGFDVRRIGAAARSKQESSGHRVVSREKRKGWFVLGVKFDCVIKETQGRFSEFQEQAGALTIYLRR